MSIRRNLLGALAGLAVSSMLTGLIAAALPAPDWSTSLVAMMGIGIGIDYALLMVTRFREWRAHGLTVEDATVATLDTAGRSVLLAGTTVVISMLGLFAMGLSFMRGAALVTVAGVLVVVISAMTLFPALLGYFGARIDRLRIPLPRRRTARSSGGWLRWSRLVQQDRLVASLAGVGILLALASPFLGVRFGFPDAGNNAPGSSTRTAYTMTASAFGPGANGPLLLAAVEHPAGPALPRLTVGAVGAPAARRVPQRRRRPAGCCHEPAVRRRVVRRRGPGAAGRLGRAPRRHRRGTPLPAFIPVLMFAVLFGLSMDYQVFLVARMRDAYKRTDDNGTAIVAGLAGTARVITAAAIRIAPPSCPAATSP